MIYISSVIILFILSLVRLNSSVTCDPEPGHPVNDPIGEEVGNFPKPGRVVWSFDRSSTNWDGKNSSFYWSPENLNFTKVKKMFDDTILSLTGASTLSESWQMIFESFNSRRYGKKGKGYEKGEKISIKINLNNNPIRYYNGNWNQVTPQFLRSLFYHLVHIVGVEEEDISIYDGSRLVEPYFVDPPTGFGKEFPKIKIYDNNGGMDYCERIEPDMDSKLIFSNTSVSDYKGTKLPKNVMEATYLIELDNFRGHSMAGMTESGKNWFGSIYRPDAQCEFGLVKENPHWCPMTLHEWVYADTIPMGSYSPFVDFLGHPHMGGKVMLFLCDGLYGGPYEDKFWGMVIPVKFESEPFNNHWSSSMFASLEPISLDSVLFDFLRNEPNVPKAHSGCIDNYLHEGALANDPPSKTIYEPDGETPLHSLGIHEHWNNAKDKEYSRNLGKDKGIELVKIFEKE